jgi:hypothetical protein
MLDVNANTQTHAHGVQTVDAEKTAVQTEIIGSSKHGRSSRRSDGPICVAERALKRLMNSSHTSVVTLRTLSRRQMTVLANVVN